MGGSERSERGGTEKRARIETLRVHKVRRSSSVTRNPNPITLSCELAVHDGDRRGTLRLYAKMFRGGASAACFESIDVARLVRPAWGEPVVHLPSLDMVLWALPNDPGLPQLAALLDPVRVRELLPWAALGLEPACARSVDVELLRHEPEQRATLRCTVAVDGGQSPVVLVAKTFDDSRGRVIDERFDHFWRQAQVDDAAPLVARPLGYDERTNTVWQASASGTPLREALRAQGSDAGALLAQVAHALACVHAAPLAASLAASHKHTTCHWVAEARRRRTKLERAEPGLDARVHALARHIEARAAQLRLRLRLRPPSLIHGDFHHDQVWLHEGRVVLFDFDEFTLGDPMEDVAAFATRLDDGNHARAFIAACAAQPGARFDRRTLQWHLALQALLQASRAFVFQRPGWRVELERWFTRAEALGTEPVREEFFA